MNGNAGNDVIRGNEDDDIINGNENDDDHFTQPGNLFRKAMSAQDRKNTISNIVGAMSGISGPKRGEIIKRRPHAARVLREAGTDPGAQIDKAAELQAKHTWRTRSDPLAKVWVEVTQMLGGEEPVTLLLAMRMWLCAPAGASAPGPPWA